MKELEPIVFSTEEADQIALIVSRTFRDEIYQPLLMELGVSGTRIQNAMSDLISAILTGRISFYRGVFSGRFGSVVSRELNRIGAKWDRRQRTFKISSSSIPVEVSTAINSAEQTFKKKMQLLDKKLEQILPEEIADSLHFESLIDRAIFRVEKNFKKSIKNITVAPDITPERMRAISAEYTNNMRLKIKDFTQQEVLRLRKKVQDSTFEGYRYETMVESIKRSYGVSTTKAQFIARQETNLLLAKYKASRYTESGVRAYKWCCVAGSANSPVRDSHKALEGKVFEWDNPPIVNSKGDRKNPGEDYNCRCFARPVINFVDALAKE